MLFQDSILMQGGWSFHDYFSFHKKTT